jgi:peroxiredoxin
VKPVAISVDSPEQSADLIRKGHFRYTFLSDPKAEVIRRYDLLHKGGGEKGQDIARPAEFLIDKSGTVRWVYLTDDLRVRARPEALIEAAKTLR